jgi:uncharacterized protein (DUF952 family)
LISDHHYLCMIDGGSPGRRRRRRIGWQAGAVKIYKLLPVAEWEAARAVGEFRGSEVDKADGYIHFSTGEQVVETAARHFAGARDLAMLTVDADRLGPMLRWEPSRGGDLFPHLYGPLPVTAVVAHVYLAAGMEVDRAVAEALA